MKYYCYIFISYLLLYLGSGCQSVTKENSTQIAKTDSLPLRYAKGFAVTYHKGYKLVKILQTGMPTRPALLYALIDRNEPQPANLPDEAQVIQIPLQSVVCLSTTHSALFHVIGETDKITGFADVRYSTIEALHQQVKTGKTKEVGGENGNPNIELILSLQPDVVMSYAENDYDKFAKFGKKVLINTEYLENTPLGRAEWVKFAAVFFNKEKIAEDFFVTVEQNYQTLQKKAQEAAQHQSQRPTVFGTIPYNGVWYLPAGNSFAANLWKDAGATYTWANSEGTGSLQVSMEEVLNKASNTDYWLNVGSIKSLDELVATDSRFADFQAIKNKKVYNCDNKQKQTISQQGNEFFEYGVVRPDIVLADLIKILYPSVLPTHEFYFYRPLHLNKKT